MVAAAAAALCWDDNDPFVLQMRHLSPPPPTSPPPPKKIREAASIKSRDQTTLRSHRGLQISAAPRRKSPERGPRFKTARSARLGVTLPPSAWSSGQLGPRPAAFSHNRKR